MAFNYHQQNAMKIDGLLLFLQFIKIYDHLINIILNGDELRNRNGEHVWSFVEIPSGNLLL